MRLLSFMLLVGLFVGLPIFLLGDVVMPALDSLQNSYAHADATAQSIVTARR